jgi:hypothetical protein
MKKTENTIQDQETTTYGRFTLNLERDGKTIFSTVSHPSGYSGSLASLEGLGYLENETWTKRKPVPQKVIQYFLSVEESFTNNN